MGTVQMDGPIKGCHLKRQPGNGGSSRACGSSSGHDHVRDSDPSDGLGYGLTSATGILEAPVVALEEWLWG
jgi:hypothetical protein